MTTTTNYTGWTIRYGFLAGNMADAEEESRAGDYAEAVKEALEAAYPGAEVRVPFERGSSGTVPYPMRPAAFDPDGEERDEVRNISRIAEEIYAAGTWLN